jgi:1,4-dihydroxy-2-naphthoyl-CoA synthase
MRRCAENGVNQRFVIVKPLGDNTPLLSRWASPTIQLKRSTPVTDVNKVVVTLADGVKRITINRADRRNAIDPESIHLLLEAVSASEKDDSRVLILTGAGEAFCAGADLQGSGPWGL